MAGHSNVKTTELYDRRGDEVSFSEIGLERPFGSPRQAPVPDFRSRAGPNPGLYPFGRLQSGQRQFRITLSSAVNFVLLDERSQVGTRCG
jgi:hypothetical protein